MNDHFNLFSQDNILIVYIFLINIILMYIKINWTTFYLANIFLILGASYGILDKYSENSIKADESKKVIENKAFFSE